jgi:hypothetical protein
MVGYHLADAVDAKTIYTLPPKWWVRGEGVVPCHKWPTTAWINVTRLIMFTLDSKVRWV